eukprot:4457014-Prymnesium_polylepis.1
MGVASKPFRVQMLEWGVAAGELDGLGFVAARRADPEGLGAERAGEWTCAARFGVTVTGHGCASVAAGEVS